MVFLPPLSLIMESNSLSWPSLSREGAFRCFFNFLGAVNPPASIIASVHVRWRREEGEGEVLKKRNITKSCCAAAKSRKALKNEADLAVPNV